MAARLQGTFVPAGSRATTSRIIIAAASIPFVRVLEGTAGAGGGDQPDSDYHCQ